MLEGETLADAQIGVEAIIAETGATLVHPYDDPEVIRGQGTIGLEIMADRPDLDAVVVPVGGGGLISGIAIAVKALRPTVEVIGVETELYPSMWAALRDRAGEMRRRFARRGHCRQECAASSPLEIARRLVDDVLLVAGDAPSSRRWRTI